MNKIAIATTISKENQDFLKLDLNIKVSRAIEDFCQIKRLEQSNTFENPKYVQAINEKLVKKLEKYFKIQNILEKKYKGYTQDFSDALLEYDKLNG